MNNNKLVGTEEFKFFPTALFDIVYLRQFTDLLDSEVALYSRVSEKPLSRKIQNGFWLFTAHHQGQKIAIIWNDFRVSGGSFSRANMKRTLSFLQKIKAEKLPLIIGVNSMGVKISEGRSVFEEVFTIIPAIEEYKSSAPVFTCSIGNAFGLGALLFGLGHYRIALAEKSQISLAGPEVFRLFFGKSINLDMHLDNKFLHSKTSLISDIVTDQNSALQLVLNIMSFDLHNCRETPYQTNETTSKQLPTPKNATLTSHLDAYKLLGEISDEFLRLFKTFDERVMVFLAKIDDQPFGVIINPPDNKNNLISVRSLNLYKEALFLFKSLELPIVSIVDTPGADPRMEVDNYLIIEKMIEVTRDIINYPYKKIGIANGRSYGGATVLLMPTIFGGEKFLAVENSKLGIMHSQTIDELLSGSKVLLSEWKESCAAQTTDFQDLSDTGTLERVIQQKELKTFIKNNFLPTQPDLPHKHESVDILQMETPDQ